MHHFGGPLEKQSANAALFGMYNSYGGSLGGGTASAGLLRCVIASQSNKGLSVSTWRKKRGDLSSTTMWGWKRGGGFYQVSSASMHWFWSQQGGGRPPKNWEMRLDGKSRGDRFAEGGARSGTMTPMSSVCHWVECLSGAGGWWVGRGQFRGVIRVITHAC